MHSPVFAATDPERRATVKTRTIWKFPPRTIRSHAHRSVLIVGSGKASRSLAAYFRQHPLEGYSVRGFVDDAATARGDVLGKVDDLSRIALAEFVDEVILTGHCERNLVRRVVAEAQRIRLSVRVIPDLFGLDPKVVTIERLGDLPVLNLHGRREPKLGLMLKRAMDVVFSAAAIIAGIPLLAGIALLITATSKGPVFYSSWRVGRKGKSFRCYKFRTMVAGSDADKSRLRQQNERRGPVFKIAKDPRVTAIGRSLRRYSFDELPQFWNVLRGEMSLVGPRPHPLDDCERYDLEHLRRLEVKPGMTGLWQVTARSDPSFQRNMVLDLEYIEGWSLWLDLCILCKTLVVVFQGSGM